MKLIFYSIVKFLNNHKSYLLRETCKKIKLTEHLYLPLNRLSSRQLDPQT